MKIFLLPIFLLMISCTEMVENIGCGTPTVWERDSAKSLYNDFYSFRVRMSFDEARKIFGCYYHRGDRIYTYSRLFDSGYILVRDDEPIAYRQKN